jgi:hypothetical protein
MIKHVNDGMEYVIGNSKLKENLMDNGLDRIKI